MSDEAPPLTLEDVQQMLRGDLDHLKFLEEEAEKEHWPTRRDYQAHLREAQRHVRKALDSLAEGVWFSR